MTGRETQVMALIHTIRSVQSRVQGLLTRALSEWDLTPQQFAVLVAMKRDGALGNADVCALLSLSKGTASGILKRLGERGLVEKHLHEEDRRASSYALTEAGEALAVRLEALHGDFAAALFEDSTNAELAAWQRHLRRIDDLLRKKEEQRDEEAPSQG